MIFHPQDHNDRLADAKSQGHDDDSARAYAGRGIRLPALEEEELSFTADDLRAVLDGMLSALRKTPPAHENGTVARPDGQTDHGEPKGA